jgi:hypothetical protein
MNYGEVNQRSKLSRHRLFRLIERFCLDIEASKRPADDFETFSEAAAAVLGD